jgi:hypothetical protein
MVFSATYSDILYGVLNNPKDGMVLMDSIAMVLLKECLE